MRPYGAAGGFADAGGQNESLCNRESVASSGGERPSVEAGSDGQREPNLGERASMVPENGHSHLRSISAQPAAKRTKNTLSFAEEMSFAVTLDGFIAEYLHGSGGYPETIAGDALCQSIGTQKVVVVSGLNA